MNAITQLLGRHTLREYVDLIELELRRAGRIAWVDVIADGYNLLVIAQLAHKRNPRLAARAVGAWRHHETSLRRRP